MPSPDVDVYRALAASLETIGVHWYLFGGQAAILHGATRFTEDIDITVLLGDVETSRLVDALLANGFDLRGDDVRTFIETTRVVPLTHTDSKIPVDVVLGGPGLEQLFAERAKETDVGGVSIPLVTVEDLIVMKVLAGRPKDLEDVVSLIRVQGSDLDAATVRDTLSLIEQALDQSDLLPTFAACATRAQKTP